MSVTRFQDLPATSRGKKYLLAYGANTPRGYGRKAKTNPPGRFLTGKRLRPSGGRASDSVAKRTRVADVGSYGQRHAKSELEKRFLALAIVWKYGVGPTSSITELTSHPAYLQIIGMGTPVVPFLLRELRDNPDHWFVALQAITGAQPVPNESLGKLDAMVTSWTNWGIANGYSVKP